MEGKHRISIATNRLPPPTRAHETERRIGEISVLAGLETNKCRVTVPRRARNTVQFISVMRHRLYLFDLIRVHSLVALLD